MHNLMTSTVIFIRLHSIKFFGLFVKQNKCQSYIFLSVGTIKEKNHYT